MESKSGIQQFSRFGGLTAVCLLAALATGARDAQSSIQVRPRLEPATNTSKAAPVEKGPGILGQTTAKDHGCGFQSISCGQTRTNNLDSHDCELDDGSFADFWAFQGTSGQQVTITMTSNAVDAYLFLLEPEDNNPNDDVRAEDDDSAGGTNARISYRLDKNGEWAFVANSLDAGETGSYTVTLACNTGGGGGVPAAPSNLQAVAVSGTEVDLTWTDNSNNETGFQVQVREGNGTFSDIGAVGPNITGASVSGLDPGVTYSFRVRASGGGGNSTFSNVATVTTGSSDGFFSDPEYPDFRFRVRITDTSGNSVNGRRESQCIEDTVCVSGQLAGRSEVFIRIVGPRPNGFLWPTLVRFTPSRVEVDIRQVSTGVTKTYVLPAVGPNDDELSGLQDRQGFLP